jgi:hypothetical protein
MSRSRYSRRRPVRGLPDYQSEIASAFDADALARICTMPEEDFAHAYGLDTFLVAQTSPNNFYHFQDNGSGILAVAHLDTVGLPHQRQARFVETEDGPVVFSRALDDRLGAYVILELLPKLGLEFDVLLTVGEEMGQSTAAFFDPPRDYYWMIEFDRGGTDVVLYQYEDDETIDLVLESGADVGDGIFSDISYLEHLECKGFNWGVGYRDYHGPRAHAFLADTFEMVSHFLNFHEQNADEYLPHEPQPVVSVTRARMGRWSWDCEEVDDDLIDRPLHSLSEDQWRTLMAEEDERLGLLG